MMNQIMFSIMYTKGCMDYDMIPYNYPTILSLSTLSEPDL